YLLCSPTSPPSLSTHFPYTTLFRSGFSRHLLEALSIQFVRDEYFAVLVRQFVERQFQFVEKQTADVDRFRPGIRPWQQILDLEQDRKSTRLNSSHRTISYAVFCLKK